MKIFVQTTVRDENDTIAEWVNHYINLGFDGIIIYDDLSATPISTTLQSSLSPEIYKKIVIHRIDHDFYESTDFINSTLWDKTLYEKSQGNKQNYFLSHYIHHYRKAADYSLFVDSDEYLWIRDHQYIKHFLEKNHTDINGIYVPWAMFGTSFHCTPQISVKESFTRHAKYLAKLGKTIVKNDLMIDYPQTPHNSFIEGGATRLWNDFDECFNTPIQLNHYVTLDLSSYLARKLRPEIGYKNGVQRSAQEIFSMACDFNDTSRLKNGNNDSGIISNWPYIFGYETEHGVFTRRSPPKDLEELKLIKNSKLINPIISFVPGDFDPLRYRALNPDLLNLSPGLLFNHFIKNCAIEGRKWR